MARTCTILRMAIRTSNSAKRIVAWVLVMICIHISVSICTSLHVNMNVGTNMNTIIPVYTTMNIRIDICIRICTSNSGKYWCLH